MTAGPGCGCGCEAGGGREGADWTTVLLVVDRDGFWRDGGPNDKPPLPTPIPIPGIPFIPPIMESMEPPKLFIPIFPKGPKPAIEEVIEFKDPE